MKCTSVAAACYSSYFDCIDDSNGGKPGGTMPGVDGGAGSPGTQTWTLLLNGGAPINAGEPPESVTVTVPPGTTSSDFSVTSGEWYVVDRLGNVVPIMFTSTFVANDWQFTGTGGPSPDGLTVQVMGQGTANADYPAATSVSGIVILNYMEPGLPAVTQNPMWTGMMN